MARWRGRREEVENKTMGHREPQDEQHIAAERAVIEAEHAAIEGAGKGKGKAKGGATARVAAVEAPRHRLPPPPVALRWPASWRPA